MIDLIKTNYKGTAATQEFYIIQNCRLSQLYDVLIAHLSSNQKISKFLD